MGLVFIGLNIADAYATGLVLAMGGIELNPLAVPLGAKMLIRGLLAAAIVALIYLADRFRGRCRPAFRLIAPRMSWLLPLNVIVLGIVLWNALQYTAP